jgi:hypothetical protein
MHTEATSGRESFGLSPLPRQFDATTSNVQFDPSRSVPETMAQCHGSAGGSRTVTSGFPLPIPNPEHPGGWAFHQLQSQLLTIGGDPSAELPLPASCSWLRRSRRPARP